MVAARRGPSLLSRFASPLMTRPLQAAGLTRKDAHERSVATKAVAIVLVDSIRFKSMSASESSVASIRYSAGNP